MCFWNRALLEGFSRLREKESECVGEGNQDSKCKILTIIQSKQTRERPKVPEELRNSLSTILLLFLAFVPRWMRDAVHEPFLFYFFIFVVNLKIKIIKKTLNL